MKKIVTDENGINSILMLKSFENAKPCEDVRCLVCGGAIEGALTVSFKMNWIEGEQITYYHTQCLN